MIAAPIEATRRSNLNPILAEAAATNRGITIITAYRRQDSNLRWVEANPVR